MNLILASTSPYRRRLLERLRLPFTCIDPAVEESIRDGESPQARACRLATEKALSVAATLQDEVIVIGSDQVACLGDQILHKPGTSEAAIAQLTASSGQTVQFWTAVSVWTSPGEPPTQRVVPCAVKMRILSNDEISRYVTLTSHWIAPVALSGNPLVSRYLRLCGPMIPRHWRDCRSLPSASS